MSQAPKTRPSTGHPAAGSRLRVRLPVVQRPGPMLPVHRRDEDPQTLSPSGSNARLGHACTLRLAFVFPRSSSADQDRHDLAVGPPLRWSPEAVIALKWLRKSYETATNHQIQWDGLLR